jgi:prevent-host-death family protein
MAAWQASNARLHFSDIVDGAVAGTPQFIERRDGKAVVVVSRAYYEQTKPNLKTFLLDAGYSGAGETAFDESLRDIRANAPDPLAPR